MPKYTTQDIRNVALTGGAGGGKTTLAEALLHHANLIGREGRIEDGNTVTDFDDLEKEFKHSLQSALVHLDHDGAHINMIDTPGSADFLGLSVSTLPAVETVVIVIDAHTGIETTTRRLMSLCKERQLPRLILINKIDGGPKLNELLANLQETFGNICQPINLPANGGKAVVDCFAKADGTSDLGDVSDFHTAIVDQVVEVDEALMAKYLEKGEVSPDELHAPFEKALREAHLVPICFCSARDNVGVTEFLDILSHLCPNPLEGNPRTFFKGEGAEKQEFTATPDPSKPMLAHIFKVSSDPFVGKLCVFRVHQGTMSAAAQPFVDDAKKPVRISHYFKLQGKDHAEVDMMIAGDIGAVAKVEEIHYNSVMHDGTIGDHIRISAIPLPKPMFGLAIEGTSKGADTKMGEGLNKLIAEDPTLKVERNSTTHETVLRGLGEQHLRIKLRLLKHRYGVEVSTQPPKVAYKETITVKAEGHHRHKKQSGGAGQFGEVFLRVEPLNGEDLNNDHVSHGLLFVDDTFGGSIPRQFLPAIEKGIRRVMEEGAVAGYPLHNVKVSVYDGKYHAVDSKEIAFMTAGRKAFIDAIQKAKPVLLEPFVKLEITIPAGMIGDISSDLSGRRGRIQGTDMLPGNQALVTAEAPLSELMSYTSQLKSITAGAGTYSMEYSHDEKTPPNVQAEVVKQFQPKEDE